MEIYKSHKKEVIGDKVTSIDTSVHVGKRTLYAVGAVFAFIAIAATLKAVHYVFGVDNEA